MNNGLQWLKTQKAMLEHRISYMGWRLERLTDDLATVEELINQMEQPDGPPHETKPVKDSKEVEGGEDDDKGRSGDRHDCADQRWRLVSGV